MVVTGVRFHPSWSVYHKNDLDAFLFWWFFTVSTHGIYHITIFHHHFGSEYFVVTFSCCKSKESNTQKFFWISFNSTKKTLENKKRTSTNDPHHLFVFALCTVLCYLCEPPGPITTINGFIGAPWLVVFETAKALPLDVPNNQHPQPASPAGEWRFSQLVTFPPTIILDGFLT